MIVVSGCDVAANLTIEPHELLTFVPGPADEGAHRSSIAPGVAGAPVTNRRLVAAGRSEAVWSLAAPDHSSMSGRRCIALLDRFPGQGRNRFRH
jgi:hypothetical protein